MSKKKKIREQYDSSDGEAYELDEEPITNGLSMGWTEDGRCGYAPVGSHIQNCPRPISGLAKRPNKRGKLYIIRKASAGARHTAFLLINTRREPNNMLKKTRKVAIVGLNQQGLCEDPAYVSMTDLLWDPQEKAVDVVAGNGTTFVITKYGNVFSCGNGRYGVLGHGDDTSFEEPRQIMSLIKQRIKMLSVGASHAMAMTYTGRIFSWGRNNKGQLGLGFESKYDSTKHTETKEKNAAIRRGSVAVLQSHSNEVDQNMEYYPATHLESFSESETCLAVACGQFHSVALVHVVAKNGSEKEVIYVWGDDSRGQLGSSDGAYRSRPQENRWCTQLLASLQIQHIAQIAAGGGHTLVLTSGTGQVVSWGAGDYGQLGHGYAWDDSRPRLITNLKDCISISAGLRHSMAVRMGSPNEVYGWGYNGYGELGVGDTNCRLQPSVITGMGRARPNDVTCGDRHSIIVTTHKPMFACEEPHLKSYFQVLEEGMNSFALKKQLKLDMREKGIDPELLNDSHAILPNQPGSNANEILNERFEKGLQYCLDTKCDPSDWRRKTYETCYQAPGLGLKSVCLSCARHCLFGEKLVPYIRYRPGIAKKKASKLVVTNEERNGVNSSSAAVDIEKSLPNSACDCILSGKCKCSYSNVRAIFDKFADIVSQCIVPNQVRKVLQDLRSPAPVDNADVEECLMTLAEGVEEADRPHIKPVEFEIWYREFYQEGGDERSQLMIHMYKKMLMKKK